VATAGDEMIFAGTASDRMGDRKDKDGRGNYCM